MLRALFTFVFFLACPVYGYANADDNPIKRLDWLIGKWTFSDVQVDGDYQETGTRDCEYTLDGYYIQCISRGTSHTGNQRTYFFFFNYNHLEHRFEAVSVIGGFPRKLLYNINVSEDNHRLEIVDGGWEQDGINFESHVIVRYNGNNQYIWESHLAHEGPENGEHQVRYRDTVTRRK